MPLAVTTMSDAATVNWDKNKVVKLTEGKVVSSGEKNSLREQELPSAEYTDKVYQNVTIGHASYTGTTECKLEANYNKGIFGDGFVVTISLMGGFAEGCKQGAARNAESIGNQLVLQNGSRIGGILNDKGEQIGTATLLYGGYVVPFADISETSASDNKVLFEGGSTVASYKSTTIYGGLVSIAKQATKAQAFASNNEVSFEKDSVIESTGYIDIYGGSVNLKNTGQAQADAYKNHVTLKSGAQVKNTGYIKICGGYVSLAATTQASAKSTYNTVTIEDGVIFEYNDSKRKSVRFVAGLADAPAATVTDEAYTAAEASHNTLSISNLADTEATWYVSPYGSSSDKYAGISAGMACSGGKTNALASNNHTYFKFGSRLTLDLSGGGYISSGWAYSTSGEAEASSNTLEMEGGILKDNVMSAGYAKGGSASKANQNTIKLDGVGQDDIGSNMYVAAGYAEGRNSSAKLEAKNNTAVIKDNTRFAVYGGLADRGSEAAADENTLQITGGESGMAFAGYAARTQDASSANKNTLTVLNSTMDWGYAGYAHSYNNADASENKDMYVQDTTIQMALYGGSAEGIKATANGNTGKLIRAKFTNEDGEFSGGMAAAISSEGSAEASDNVFDAEGGTFANVYGGQAISLETSKSTVKAEGNGLTLTDAEVLKAVYGGYAESTADTGSDAEAASGDASASKNTLVLNGGRFSGNIYGGYASVTNSTAEASSNTVELRPGTNGEAPVFADAKSVLWGGCAISGSTADTSSASTGNTLKMYDVKGMTAANIRNFQAIEFEHAELQANDVVMELTGSDDDKTTSIAGAEVTVSVKSLKGAATDIFQPGEKVILLKNASEKGLDTSGIRTTLVTPVVTAGVSISYEVEIRTNENELYLTRTGSEPEPVLPGTKAIAEGALAGLALVNESAEAVFEAMEDMAEQDLFTFGAVHAGSKTYASGSSISLSSVSMLAGIGKGFATKAGHLSIGAFFEYGKGSYTTHNSFDTRSDVDGDGNSWYMGGGILGKMSFKDTGPGHFYVEGSAHMGTLHNEYYSNDLTDSSGNVARFDMDSPYYFLHGGLGYVWNFAEGHEINMYGKYLWTMVQGTDDTLTTSDKYDFDDMYSNRVRAGVRYSYTGSERFRPYVGVAWEHEFSGSCNARAYGYDVSSPSIEGGTGIGELGIAMMPTDSLPLYLNLGVQGYVGTKKGISGSCNFVYEF